MISKFCQALSRMLGRGTENALDPHEKVTLNTGERFYRSEVTFEMQALRKFMKTDRDAHQQLLDVCFGRTHFILMPTKMWVNLKKCALLWDNGLEQRTCAVLISATSEEKGKLKLIDPVSG